MWMIKKSPKIPLYYILGKYRYWAYYSKHFKWVLRIKIKESIEFLNESLINEECFNNASCKNCGCQVPQQNYGGKPCDCFWINLNGDIKVNYSKVDTALMFGKEVPRPPEVTSENVLEEIKKIYEERLTKDLFFRNENTKPGGDIDRDLLTKLEPESIIPTGFEISLEKSKCNIGTDSSKTEVDISSTIFKNIGKTFKTDNDEAYIHITK